jgi:hypothetical protein
MNQLLKKVLTDKKVRKSATVSSLGMTLFLFAPWTF